MQLRKRLLLDNQVQLVLLLAVLILGNVLAARHFARLDLTRDHVFTLSEASRVLAGELEKPLFVKVYFTRGLEAPYNNHQQVLVDKLEEFRAYSGGRMEIEVLDPTGEKELEEEAQRFGIQPIQYRYQGSDRAELKRVYMGASFVYGERQAAMEAVTQVATVEYDVARTIRKLLDGDDRKTVGFSTGHQEVDALRAQGPLETLRNQLAERYDVVGVPLGGEEGVPEEVDALVVLGPQAQFSDRGRYQLDQFLMRGGSLAVFIANTRPDLRTMRPEPVFSGLEGFLGQLGAVVGRDVVVDRTQNGMMRVPVRRGRYMLQVPVNHPIIPKITDISSDNLIVKGLDQMLFPFTSSVTLLDPLPPGVEGQVLARASAEAGRLLGLRTLDPAAFQQRDVTEEKGAFPVMAALTGTWESTFKSLPIPSAPAQTPFGTAVVAEDDPASKITEGASARLVVTGSADAVANNIPMMLNLVDWMVQDEALIGIRSKAVQLPPLERPEPAKLRWIRLVDALGGVFVLLLVGLGRWLALRRTPKTAEVG